MREQAKQFIEDLKQFDDWKDLQLDIEGKNGNLYTLFTVLSFNNIFDF